MANPPHKKIEWPSAAQLCSAMSPNTNSFLSILEQRALPLPNTLRHSGFWLWDNYPLAVHCIEPAMSFGRPLKVVFYDSHEQIADKLTLSLPNTLLIRKRSWLRFHLYTEHNDPLIVIGLQSICLHEAWRFKPFRFPGVPADRRELVGFRFLADALYLHKYLGNRRGYHADLYEIAHQLQKIIPTCSELDDPRDHRFAPNSFDAMQRLLRRSRHSVTQYVR